MRKRDTTIQRTPFCHSWESKFSHISLLFHISFCYKDISLKQENDDEELEEKTKSGQVRAKIKLHFQEKMKQLRTYLS